MKKVVYVVVVLVILLVLSMLLKSNKAPTNEVAVEVKEPAAVEAVVDQAAAPVVEGEVAAVEVAPLEEGAVVVDAEPVAEATAEAPVVVEEVVEENPETTAGEGETVVE
ncbi:MAG: hypothetical protein IKA30_00365 [Alphaproteobacteria bacterium]|nr:hypothetical protein [Alphaproteobacteria bacterium]